MKKTYLAVAVAAALATHGVVHAQDYQAEAGLSYIDIDVDGFSDSAIGLDFTYFIESVNTQDRPLAEAYFLGRNSNVGASYMTVDEADIDTLGLSAEFWIENIYVAADFSRVDDGFFDETFNDYSARLGYMMSDSLLGYVGLKDGDSFDENSFLAGVKYVADIGSGFVNLEAEIETNDGDNMLSLMGDYFFSNQFSAGVRVVETDVDGVDTGFGVGTRYFFTPTVSGELEYFTQDDVDVIGLRAAARF